MPKVGITEQTPEQVRTLLATNGNEPDPNRVFFIEAQAVNAHDAAAWAMDLAHRVPLDGEEHE